MSLQALTLLQPWPRMMLLDENPKRIENRTWMPPRDLIGKHLALHGGAPPRTRKAFGECRSALDWVNERVWGGEEDPTDWERDEDLAALCVTGIYAVARVVSVVTDRSDPWRNDDPYGWVLDDFTPIEPVHCRGHKNLWPVDGEVLKQVRQRWQAARHQAAPGAIQAGSLVIQMSEPSADPGTRTDTLQDIVEIPLRETGELPSREQESFARFMRDRLPIPRGMQEHPLHFLTEYAARVLGRPRLLHWRSLSPRDAQAVMAAAAAEFPARGASPFQSRSA